MRPNSHQSHSGNPSFNPKIFIQSTTTNKTRSRHSSHQRNFRDYVLMVRERWLIGFATAAILVGLLAFYQLRQPKVYRATASLIFESNNPQVIDIQEVVDTSLQSATADTALQTHVGQIKSLSFYEYVQQTFTEEEIERLLSPYLIPEEKGKSPTLPDIILAGIDASLVRGTYLISISAEHRDPECAALIANRYAREYIDYHRERTASGNDAALAFLREQRAELLDKVGKADAALQEFRQTHNLVSLQENQNIILRRLSKLSEQLMEARVERLALDSKLAHVQEYLVEDKNLLEIEFIASYGSVRMLMKHLDELESERALLEERYLEKHPKMIEITSLIETINKQLRENTRMAVTELLSHQKEVANHEALLETELADSENESLRLEEIAAEYEVLLRQAESSRNAHTRVVDRLNETMIASQLNHINIKIADGSPLPHKPIEPNLRKIILQSAFLGCFIFIGLPLGLGILDQKLKAAWEVELFLGHPLLGEIPRINRLKKRDRPHIIAQGRKHAACEAFKGIFSQLQLNSNENESRTILLTSTLPGEGKSLVASNLAATFANHGKQTLLIDCDFRRPALHYHYERKNDRGIIRWLEMDEPDFELLHPDEALDILPLGHRLHFLRAGGESRNPTEMFNLPKFRKLFADLKEEYDIILVDTPPVGIFPDALLLAPLCDQLLYVCQFNRVNKTQIRKLMEKVEMTKIEVGGMILNSLPNSRISSSYDYYGYGQFGNNDYRAYYAQKR